MKNEKSIYMLDAYALIYRSYYAFINNPRVTTTGINTSAAFGFTNFLIDLIEEENPEYLVIVFDPEGPTFRHEMYSEYKAQRPPMPEDLKKGIPAIKKIITALGIEMIEVDGYEADDVIGTLAKKAENENFKVYMITSDKDYAQLVSDSVVMLRPGRSGGKSEVWGIAEVLDRFGIERVDQVVDILGLMGDASDNVPGCMGIGPKSAASLIYKYGDIEGVYKNINELKGKQKENLLTCESTVSLSKKLVTICTKVPIDVSIEAMKKEDIKEIDLEKIFRELEFFSLLKRVLAIEESNIPQEQEVVEIEYKELRSEKEFIELIKKLEKVPEFAINSTIRSGSCYSRYPDMIAFSFKKHEVYTWIMPEDQKERERIIGELKPLFSRKETLFISEDIKRDMLWLKRAGVEVKSRIFDIKIAHYLLQPDLSHDLERISLEMLNEKVEKELHSDSKQLAISFEEDQDSSKEQAIRCDLVFRLKSQLDKELKSTGLDKLFEGLEMPLVFVLAAMEYEGVSIDTEELEKISQELKTKIAAIEQTIYEKAGEEFNVGSPKQLGEILFKKLKIDPGNRKTKTGQYSTSEQVLSKFEERHSIVSDILEYRGMKKILSTYAEALPTYIDRETEKIHTSFNQAEAATGRLSSLNPNLQNIPVRTEEGRNIRKAFVTGAPDYLFLSADYSQVELRLMAHMSGDKELITAFLNNEDIHATTASKIYNVALDKVTPEMRRRAKTANFGIIYGISAWGLAERLKISRKDGKELIDGYFEHYPGVKEYMNQSVENARKKGYVETIMGRRRYLRNINSRNAVVRGVAERNAVNAPIQGSAADIIKKAMILIQDEIDNRNLHSKMILQVHDELDFKCHKDEIEILKTLITDKMENVVKLSVPLPVSIGIGKNWYEAH